MLNFLQGMAQWIFPLRYFLSASLVLSIGAAAYLVLSSGVLADEWILLALVVSLWLGFCLAIMYIFLRPLPSLSALPSLGWWQRLKLRCLRFAYATMAWFFFLASASLIIVSFKFIGLILRS